VRATKYNLYLLLSISAATHFAFDSSSGLVNVRVRLFSSSYDMSTIITVLHSSSWNQTLPSHCFGVSQGMGSVEVEVTPGMYKPNRIASSIVSSAFLRLIAVGFNRVMKLADIYYLRVPDCYWNTTIFGTPLFF
jgi:hypothetical protein